MSRCGAADTHTVTYTFTQQLQPNFNITQPDKLHFASNCTFFFLSHPDAITLLVLMAHQLT